MAHERLPWSKCSALHTHPTCGFSGGDGARAPGVGACGLVPSCRLRRNQGRVHLAARVRLSRRDGLDDVIGLSVGLVIAFLGPRSGGSINPARQFGPAALSGRTTDLWIYLVAPVLGAVLGASVDHALNRRFRTRRALVTIPTAFVPDLRNRRVIQLQLFRDRSRRGDPSARHKPFRIGDASSSDRRPRAGRPSSIASTDLTSWDVPIRVRPVPFSASDAGNNSEKGLT
ncbi:aquaporin [Rhodococcus sp. JS3073]|uniref:aquaporin n=1 Tax=Rhodococcus sp. JS3073 TaxID=3002901 RepID=UPI003FA73800